VFKTESVIMPVFLDSLGGSPLIRGWLPLCSRIFNSVPQYLIAHRLQGLARLRPVLAVVTVVQGCAFLLLGALPLFAAATVGSDWIAMFFFVYCVFWLGNGISMLVQGLLQEKLIPYQRRGSLLGTSNFAGCLLAIGALVVWMLPNLETGNGARGFAMVFLATGVLFLLTAALSAALDEPHNLHLSSSEKLADSMRQSFRLVVYNGQYRLLLTVMSIYYAVILLFPHFASFGSERLGVSAASLVSWVIVQNVGTALGSAAFGSIADRAGNRLVLRLLLFWLALIPIVAVALARLPPQTGRSAYWMVFAMLGLTPVGQRLFVNYLLELAPENEHGHYLGTFNLWQAIPLLASPAVGWLIERSSYETVFLAGSGVLLAGAWLAGRMVEPRDGVETLALTTTVES
jgi:MFS family permease